MAKKVNPVFYARLKDKKFKFEAPEIFGKFIKTNFKENDRLVISVKKFYQRRSTGQLEETGNQNGYYWAVVLPLVAEFMGESSTQKVHEIMLEMFAPRVSIDNLFTNHKIVIKRRSSDMNTYEFSEYIENIRALMLEYGVNIPDPTTVGY